MKSNYHERREKRIEAAKNRAEKNAKASQDAYKQVMEISSFIPPGQPILVGHHSQKRHMRDIERMDNGMRKSIELDNKAEYYADKAKIIENNTAISSDNPEALQLLKEKLTQLEQKQSDMKEINRLLKSKDKAAFLQRPGATETSWIKANTPDCMGTIGFARFSLSNNNAKINTVKKRIAAIEKLSTKQTKETVIKGITIIENVEQNRLQLKFDSKPNEETRKSLKSKGFRFSYTESAWQRQLTNSAIYTANSFLAGYQQDKNSI